MNRICRQCPEPVGARAPSAYLCIKCALTNTRPKRWSYKELVAEVGQFLNGRDVYTEALDAFLDYLKEQA